MSDGADIQTHPIEVVMPWGEVRHGRYRWLYDGEPGADGMTLRITKWTEGYDYLGEGM